MRPAAPRAQSRRAAGVTGSERLGAEGNEMLTSATAALLILLLAAEGITIIRMGGLVGVHMFIGLLLIPPVLLKIASVGYRFVRYYTGAKAYRVKGPPLLPLRLLAPVLVASTVGVLATGVWLLLLGHRSDQVLQVHQIAFIVFGVVFAIHFLAYVPRMVRSLRADWGPIRRQAVPGTGVRGMLVAASLGAGLALALTLLSAIEGWNGGHFG
ncbi:MAG: hypothetical protein QOI10_1635 [Solirubrobacterales bacterium]|jgi:hypothetical protein|nr:hypothetical protein [Solirubrobacterales bacterium]